MALNEKSVTFLYPFRLTFKNYYSLLCCLANYTKDSAAAVLYILGSSPFLLLAGTRGVLAVISLFFFQFLHTNTKTVPKLASDHFAASHFQFILCHRHFHKQSGLIFLLSGKFLLVFPRSRN
jgi:hypothetical protein